MFEIDRAEVSESEETVMIEGWCVMRGHDNARHDKKLLLKNTVNSKTYEMELYPKLRYDVEALFQEDTKGVCSCTKNVALAGIQCIIDKTLSMTDYFIMFLINSKLHKRLGDYVQN